MSVSMEELSAGGLGKVGLGLRPRRVPRGSSQCLTNQIRQSMASVLDGIVKVSEDG